MTELGCTTVGGTYQGDGTTCDPNPCISSCDYPCVTDEDCLVDLCLCPAETACVDDCCEHTVIGSRPYADLFPVPCGDGAVEIMDTLTVLDAAGGAGVGLTMIGSCMAADIFPCPPPEGGGCDGAVEIMDTLSVLDAANGSPGCDPWCP
jgi:hypothetical protein